MVCSIILTDLIVKGKDDLPFANKAALDFCTYRPYSCLLRVSQNQIVHDGAIPSFRIVKKFKQSFPPK